MMNTDELDRDPNDVISTGSAILNDIAINSNWYGDLESVAVQALDRDFDHATFIIGDLLEQCRLDHSMIRLLVFMLWFAPPLLSMFYSAKLELDIPLQADAACDEARADEYWYGR